MSQANNTFTSIENIIRAAADSDFSLDTFRTRRNRGEEYFVAFGFCGKGLYAIRKADNKVRPIAEDSGNAIYEAFHALEIINVNNYRIENLRKAISRNRTTIFNRTRKYNGDESRLGIEDHIAVKNASRNIRSMMTKISDMLAKNSRLAAIA